MLAIAEFFIKNYKFTLVLTFGMVVFGLKGVLGINSESYPSVDFAMATIETRLDGASAEEIETKITKKIEDEVRTVTGIKDVRSTSQPGLSSILVRADLDNIDVEAVMSDLQRAVDRVSDLPTDLRDDPKFVEIKSEEFPVLELAIIGANEGRSRDVVADFLKEEIEDNKSVLSVRFAGFAKRRFNVDLDQQLMHRYHVGVDQVIEKIRSRNVNIPGGKLEAENDQKLVRLEGEAHSIGEIEEIVVRSNFSGSIVRVKDIARVTDGQEQAKVLTRYDGKEATLLIVTKKGGTDTIALVEDIQEKIARFRNVYDNQFKFVIYNNEATRVENKLSILTSNAVSGLVLVIVFLLIFLPGRIGVVASLSLPLGVMATLGFITPLGMNLNAVTILALVIALGMLVDNSVVISENFARLRSEGFPKGEAAMESIRTLWLPITATVFTTIAAFLPMLVTTGIMGEFIKYIPVIVSVALLISLVESFFLLPMRLAKVDSSTKSTGENKWFDKLSYKFETFVRVAVRLRYVSFFVFSALLVTSVLMMVKFNKMILFPAEQTEIYMARLEMNKGTRLEDTNRVVENLSQQIQEKFGHRYKHIVSRAGIATMGPNDPKKKDGDHIGSVFLYATDDTKNNVKHTVVLEELRQIAVPEGAKSLSFEAVINGPPVGEPVNVTFRSNNMQSLSEVVEKVVSKLEQTPGVRDIGVDTIVGDDEVYVELDYAKADRLGLNADSVGNAIRSAVSGKNISTVNINNKEVDVFMRLQKLDRLELSDLNQIRLSDRNGNLIPLSSVASLKTKPGGPQIKRFDYKRSKTVSAQIDDKKITAIGANLAVQEFFEEIAPRYPDVSLVFGGEGESTKESMTSLFNALVISLIGIFALLVLLFNSFVMPFIIMTTIPLGLVGFSVAFAAHGKPISFLALIGIIGLGGIIVNSGIILISFINTLRSEEMLSLNEALAKASRLRLRAVVVSSLTTISGLLPTAYGIGGMDAILMPMTLAMAWGLTSGTVLTLVWVPCAYAISDDVDKLLGRLRRRVLAVMMPLVGRTVPMRASSDQDVDQKSDLQEVVNS